MPEIKINHIAEGIKNSILPREEVEKIAKVRAEICAACSYNSANKDKAFFTPGKNYSKIRPDAHCTICACNIHAKVRSLKSKCPIDKWVAVKIQN